MELKGTQQIRGARADVWAALNDPAVLQQCIPGCETFAKDSDSTYRIVVMAAVGPVKAKFNGKLILSDIRDEQGYLLSFEGSGGVAGFAKGGASVSLEAVDEGTLLRYEANAKVGGKLAQVGARLIDGVAAKMADEFFGRFKAAVERPGDTDAVPPGALDGASNQGKESAPGVAPQAAVLPSGQVARPIMSFPTIALLIAVAVVSYLLGRLG